VVDEIERSLAAGVSVKGRHWHRDGDTLGVAWVMNGISDAHRAYLSGGGTGFLIGDGRLDNYRPEEILEAYYSFNATRGLWFTVDAQHIANPAYNADRGPVNILVVRSAGHDSAVLPRFGLSYQADERELAYLTVTKGYGSGGMWAFFIQCLGEAPAPIGTDTLWSYEIGTKSRLLNGRLQLDTGIFHIAWNNRGQSYDQLTACNTAYLGTPGAAASNGFDLAVRELIGAHVKADLSLAYTDARYTKTLSEDGALVVRQGEAIGTLPHVASPWNVTGSIEYTVGLPRDTTAALRVDDVFRSRNPGPFVNDNPGYYDPGNQPDPSTNLVNLRATLRWASYDMALFVNNALDAHPTLLWKTAGLGIPPYLATTFRPRTVGLTANWRF
jgi:iron complex outermembrane receptor protein